MIDYILGFDTYPTMNSWNGSYGYSFDVKIHSLALNHDERDKLYEIIFDECLSEDFHMSLNDVIRRWEDRINEYYDKGRYDPNQHITELYEDKRHKSRCNKCGNRTWYEGEKPCQICDGTLIAIPPLSDERREYIEKRQFEIGFNGRSDGHLVLYKWNGYNYSGTGWTHNKDELHEMLKPEVEQVYKILKLFEGCYDELLATAKEFASYEVEEVEEEVTNTITYKQFK